MSKVFIIAEAGSNWKVGSPAQDLKMAKALIDAAKEAGADAVKFQTYRAETVYVPNAGSSDYLAKNGIRRSITEIFRDLAMPYAMIPKLAAHAKKRRIEFMSSAFSETDFKAVDPYVLRHKIASYEISHPRLLTLAAKSGKPLILSTGACAYKDIDWAVDFFKRSGGRSISLMQCTAKYPAPFSALNLRVIPEMLRRYRVPVGLSDHSMDPVVGPLTAVALGATLLEKHFTMDRKLRGPDHAFAVTPQELKKMVFSVRNCEEALGDGKKRVLSVEKELKAYAQRALQATRDISKGEVMREGHNIGILRPGKQLQGAHPKHLNSINGKRASRSIPVGRGVRLKDVGDERS